MLLLTDVMRRGWLAFLRLPLAIAAAFAQGDRRDRVTYTTFRPGNWDIFRFSEPGAPPERLTADPGLEYDPVVSPDGRWLVFCSERLGSPDLFALDLLRGGEPRLLIDSEALEDQAAFSPDGRTLAFVGTSSGNADLYTVPFSPARTLAMGDAQNLTRTSAGEFRPAFSPDGRTLAFSSDRDAPVLAVSPIVRLRHGDVYTMDIASRRTRRLTDWPGWDSSPSWSADGSGSRLEIPQSAVNYWKPARVGRTQGLVAHGTAAPVPPPAPSRPRGAPDLGEGPFIAAGSPVRRRLPDREISDEEPLVQGVIFAPQMYGEMYAYRIADGALVRLTHNKWEEGVPSWERAPSR